MDELYQPSNTNPIWSMKLSGKDMAKARDVWQQVDAVILDVDATLIQELSLYELVKFCGKEQEVNELVRSSLSKDFIDTLINCIETIKPSKNMIKEFNLSRNLNFSPRAKELVNYLQENGVHIYLVSGSLKSLIVPLAKALNIPEENIYSNTLKFRDNGDYTGFHESSMTKTYGKAEVAHMLKKKFNYKYMVNIGDGLTDLEAAISTDAFIGYGGNIERKIVKDQAMWYITDFGQLLSMKITNRKLEMIQKENTNMTEVEGKMASDISNSTIGTAHDLTEAKNQQLVDKLKQKSLTSLKSSSKRSSSSSNPESTKPKTKRKLLTESERKKKEENEDTQDENEGSAEDSETSVKTKMKKLDKKLRNRLSKPLEEDDEEEPNTARKREKNKRTDGKMIKSKIRTTIDSENPSSTNERPSKNQAPKKLATKSNKKRESSDVSLNLSQMSDSSRNSKYSGVSSRIPRRKPDPYDAMMKKKIEEKKNKKGGELTLKEKERLHLLKLEEDLRIREEMLKNREENLRNKEEKLDDELFFLRRQASPHKIEPQKSFDSVKSIIKSSVNQIINITTSKRSKDSRGSNDHAPSAPPQVDSVIKSEEIVVKSHHEGGKGSPRKKTAGKKSSYSSHVEETEIKHENIGGDANKEEEISTKSLKDLESIESCRRSLERCAEVPSLNELEMIARPKSRLSILDRFTKRPGKVFSKKSVKANSEETPNEISKQPNNKIPLEFSLRQLTKKGSQEEASNSSKIRTEVSEKTSEAISLGRVSGRSVMDKRSSSSSRSKKEEMRVNVGARTREGMMERNKKKVVASGVARINAGKTGSKEKGNESKKKKRDDFKTLYSNKNSM